MATHLTIEEAEPRYKVSLDGEPLATIEYNESEETWELISIIGGDILYTDEEEEEVMSWVRHHVQELEDLTLNHDGQYCMADH